MPPRRILWPLVLLIPLLGFIPLRHLNQQQATRQLLALARNHGHPSPKVVQRLLARGADVNARSPFGTSILCYLAQEEIVSLKGVELLIVAGADINARDSNGKTPLMLAARRGFAAEYESHDLVGLLLKHGANTNARDNRGRNVLDIVTATMRWDDKSAAALIARLKAHGAKP